MAVAGWVSKEAQEILVGQAESGLKPHLRRILAEGGHEFSTIKDLAAHVIQMDERIHALDIEERTRYSKTRNPDSGPRPVTFSSNFGARPELSANRTPVHPSYPDRYIDGTWLADFRWASKGQGRIPRAGKSLSNVPKAAERGDVLGGQEEGVLAAEVTPKSAEVSGRSRLHQKLLGGVGWYGVELEENESMSLIGIEGIIQTGVKCLWDSGASFSYIDGDFLKVLGLKAQALGRPRKLVMFDGSCSSGGAITHSIDVSIKLREDREARPIKLYVTKLAGSHVVIGRGCVMKLRS
ncbi:hypothetical protein DB88DRAFT_473155 [Papiliotrema laurentii]|uniref:Uncharacterized protein n=1 Tax=Papiliotrema laurentii TaxID=5418 RepID=A0AAD9CWZ2_PAPLA|nr:hypothetical protein DB88DRAFT_473155 [Papiliotrema laurentii]